MNSMGKMYIYDDTLPKKFIYIEVIKSWRFINTRSE